jgi:hypothetical protein
MKKNNKADSIFISIASYRDPELVPTVIDCINSAKYKNNLFFGIVWQKDDTENIDLLKKYSNNIKVYDCDWRDSKGACWSRHLIQKQLFNNEQYYLQLDSHHRFLKNWDVKLIQLLKYAKSKLSNKPIIGSYGTTYWNRQDELEEAPYKINTFESFTDDGDLISKPVAIQESIRSKHKLIPARLLSGHFIFTDGHFVNNCMYDPNYYFRGEELVLSARAYTHGYDMYHPTKSIIWHQYLRVGQPKHWDDHQKHNGFIIEAEDRNFKSKARQRALFKMDHSDIDFKQYGFGNERTLQDYELYCGVDFKNRRVHKYAYNIIGDAPDPYVMSYDEWNSGMLQKYTFEIEWDLSKISPEKDYDFWFFGFETATGQLVYRNDFKNDNKEHLRFFNKQSNKYTASISCESKPSRCVIIPHSASNGWMPRIHIPC